MNRTRVEIKMTFSADLDPVKGWGDNPNDWCTMLEQRIGASNGGPYNTKLAITDINCRDATAHTPDQVQAICRAVCKVEGIDPDENRFDDLSDANWTRYADAVATALSGGHEPGCQYDRGECRCVFPSDGAA